MEYTLPSRSRDETNRERMRSQAERGREKRRKGVVSAHGDMVNTLIFGYSA